MFYITVDSDIRLEHTYIHHAQDIFHLVSKEQNRTLFRQWLPWVEHNTTIDDTQAFIQTTLEKYAKAQEVNCSIFYQDKLVGNVSLLGMRNSPNDTQKGELGYWLDVDHHGKGIMKRAVKKMLEIGFTYYHLDKISIKCATQNHRSCNIPQSLGFKYEGTLRADIMVEGIVQDGKVYSLLKEEYQA